MRLINADELCENLMTEWDTADAAKRKDISEIMAKVVCPIVIGTLTVDAEPVVHARWELATRFPDGLEWRKCSRCGRAISAKDDLDCTNQFPYCHCGAKMDLK